MMGSASPLRPNRIVVREDYLTVRLCLSKRLYNLIDASLFRSSSG